MRGRLRGAGFANVSADARMTWWLRRFEAGVAGPQGGWTALIWAVMRSQAEMVKLLIGRGADQEVKDGVSWAGSAKVPTRGGGGRGRLEAAGQRSNFLALCLLIDAACRVCSTLAAQDEHVHASNFCDDEACLLVIQDSERIQRWHRRRLLAAWRHGFRNPGPARL